MNAKIMFAKLYPEAIIPSKRDEDGGFDLFACLDSRNPHGITLKSFTTTMVPTGLIYACDKDWVLVLKERGSTASISMKIGAGVSDSGYRNELFVFLYNGRAKDIVITPVHEKVYEDSNVIFYPVKKAIAQFLVLPVPKTEIIVATEEEVRAVTSERGLGLLGSSGK